MPSAFDDLCSEVRAHHEREYAFEMKCISLAQSFRNGILRLGFPESSLSWVPWGDRSLDGRGQTIDRVIHILQDEGCDGATLRISVAALPLNPFFFFPELRLRFADSSFTLICADKSFSGPDAERVGEEAANYCVTLLREQLAELPAAWLRDAQPKPSKRKSIGFARR